MKLSPFTNAINETFGSNVAIPNGADYGYIRKILGEGFESTINDFKQCTHGSTRITEKDPLAMDTGWLVDGKKLKFIEFQENNEVNRDGYVGFQNGKLPSIKFTKLESETFSLFHEMGHAIDDDIRIPLIKNETTDEKNRYWLRENFADFFASLMLAKATGSSLIIESRILPFRALSQSYLYQTTGSIKWAMELADKHDLPSMSEIKVKELAISEWNNHIFEKVPDLFYEAKTNIVSLTILDRCIELGGPQELLNTFSQENHPLIIQHLTDFNSKFIKPIAANAYSFKNPLKDLTKIQMTISQPLSDLLTNVKRELKFDKTLSSYLTKFPLCPLLPKQHGHSAAFGI
jgi:hypothetical protein